MEDYFLGLEKQYKTGHAKEHGYRPDLKVLFEKLLEGVIATNDPKRSEHGAPDFIFTKGELIYGYAEAKDIDVALDKVAQGEQLKRYFGYSNLILTNYIDFRFYRNGIEWCEPISIAHFENGILISNNENYDALTRAILDFYTQAPERIKSANRLTKIMGGRARRIRDNVSKYLEIEDDKNLDIIKIYEVIKKNLVHDISHTQFADMYAQTLVYGLFVARYHDNSLNTFSRQEARDLIPASNPFLQHFFDHLAGANFDKRLAYIIDELCEIFAVSDVKELMNDYKKDRDPVIHFYEDFLFEYDNDLRKKMGVFYTPAPVVSFIVRAVDEILKKDFNLVNGIADTSKISVEKEIQGKKKKVGTHRVQILDPATGTGTFLNEIIKYIHTNNFSNEKSLWSSYVNNDLLPRLHGFELMMASYTIAHLKLAMTLRETGVEEFKERVGIYLTNSLEEGKVNPDDLFGSFGLMDTITKESSEASRIKTEYPVMVVIGNPPYSISSNNKGEWIQNQIKEYKKHLNERNIQPLSDDYIKFIRFSEFLIEKNGEGVVAMITNNSFLDGIIHKQMRKHLLETFDQIYIVDLHGNARKSEQTKSGLKDENVFKIMQGVSINIFVKNNKKKKGVLAKVFSFDLQGLQKDKFEYLDLNSLEKIIWNSVDYTEPNYFFTKKDFSGQFEYEKGFKLDELIKDYSSGVKTHHDSELISIQPFEENNFVYYYKPYDIQYINYDLKKVVRAREAHTRNYLKQINLGLILQRGFLDTNISTSSQIIVTKIISDINFLKAQTYNFPLYLYFDNGLKTPNLDKYIWSKLNETTEETKPEDILDYIYAVLHSPKYRETYKEFLKIDFPRVPYPKSKKEFWNLVPLGTQLRELHLLEAKELESFNLGITFIGDGEVVVEKPLWMDNKIYLNKEHYFEGVSKEVFEFYIGGYQPAQKWLKDRKGRALTAEDIIHYKKMCVSMRRTIEIMKEIDTVIL